MMRQNGRRDVTNQKTSIPLHLKAAHLSRETYAVFVIFIFHEQHNTHTQSHESYYIQ
jgi:hypothetical protein